MIPVDVELCYPTKRVLDFTKQHTDMAITILTGLPGSGKSETLITKVGTALREGRVALTFLSCESPILHTRVSITEHRRLSCRSGLHTPLDHFVSNEQAIELLGDAPPGTLLAFDEAQYFGEQLAESWYAASDRGVEILIASPSAAQLKALNRRGYDTKRMQLTCQVCQERTASRFFCHLDDDRTESVCDDCFERLKAKTKAEIIDRLRRGAPYPREEWTYQPVELPECSRWGVIRMDTRRRFQLIKDICASRALPSAHSSYLDVGCSTGFFCLQMSKAGFRSTGVDVAANDIEIARLLSTYFRRDYATYVVSDAYEYLKVTQDRTFDVTSAFSVFQWVMIQNTPEHGLDCMRWLFQKTKRICILEMGDSTEAHYIERIGLKYDSAWIYDFAQTNGGFERIDLIDRKSNKLKRDLLIGYKA